MSASHRVNTILCAAAPRGSEPAVELLVQIAEQRSVDAIALVGDLSGDGDGPAAYRRIFRALGRAGRPAYWVPGAGDAPLGPYLRESHAVEAVHPMVHGVHGTAAITPDGHVVVAGMGGELDDDPEAERDERTRLRYPRWEAEYRLKVLDELAEHARMLLFCTRPVHKGLHRGGSETVTELVNTHRPRLAVCGGERGAEMLGVTLVVSPGSMTDGCFTIADLHKQEIDLVDA
jgi:Icc-related predicted phosphoesterase